MDNTSSSPTCASPPPSENHQRPPIVITSDHLTLPPVTMDNTFSSLTCASPPPPENHQLSPIMITSNHNNTSSSPTCASLLPLENHQLPPIMITSNHLTPPPVTMDNTSSSPTCVSPPPPENHQLPPVMITSNHLTPPSLTMDNKFSFSTCAASPPPSENHQRPPVLITSRHLPPPPGTMPGPSAYHQYHHLGVPIMAPSNNPSLTLSPPLPYHHHLVSATPGPLPALNIQPMASYYLDEVFMATPASLSSGYRLWDAIIASVVNSANGSRSIIPVEEHPSTALAASLVRMKNSDAHSDNDDFSFFTVQPWEYFECRKIT